VPKTTSCPSLLTPFGLFALKNGGRGFQRTSQFLHFNIVPLLAARAPRFALTVRHVTFGECGMVDRNSAPPVRQTTLPAFQDSPVIAARNGTATLAPLQVAPNDALLSRKRATRRRVSLNRESQFVIILLTDLGQNLFPACRVSIKVVTAQCRAHSKRLPERDSASHCVFFPIPATDWRQIAAGRIARRNWYCGILMCWGNQSIALAPQPCLTDTPLTVPHRHPLFGEPHAGVSTFSSPDLRVLPRLSWKISSDQVLVSLVTIAMARLRRCAFVLAVGLQESEDL